jgi:hypothetical protein
MWKISYILLSTLFRQLVILMRYDTFCFVTVSTILSDFLNRIFFSQTLTDVSKNSPKTAKNTEKWFSRNISGEMCWQAICVWYTLIQVNQDNSASVS